MSWRIGFQWPKWIGYILLVNPNSRKKGSCRRVWTQEWCVGWKWITLLFVLVYVAQLFQMGLRKRHQSNCVCLLYKHLPSGVVEKQTKLQHWWSRKYKQEGEGGADPPLIFWLPRNLERFLRCGRGSLNPALRLTCDVSVDKWLNPPSPLATFLNVSDYYASHLSLFRFVLFYWDRSVWELYVRECELILLKIKAPHMWEVLWLFLLVVVWAGRSEDWPYIIPETGLPFLMPVPWQWLWGGKWFLSSDFHFEGQGSERRQGDGNLRTMFLGELHVI